MQFIQCYQPCTLQCPLCVSQVDFQQLSSVCLKMENKVFLYDLHNFIGNFLTSCLCLLLQEGPAISDWCHHESVLFTLESQPDINSELAEDTLPRRLNLAFRLSHRGPIHV